MHVQSGVQIGLNPVQHGTSAWPIWCTNRVTSSTAFDQSLANLVFNRVKSSTAFDQSLANLVSNRVKSSSAFDQSLVNLVYKKG